MAKADEVPIKSSSINVKFRNRKTDRAPRLSLGTRSGSFTFNEFANNPFVVIVHPLDTNKKYPLEEVCKDVKGACKSKKSSHHSVNHYVCKWLEQVFVDELVNSKLKTEWDGLEVLEPFCVSSSMRIDVAVLAENEIPILLIEIHSNVYENTVAHCAIALIFQLRYVRLFDQTIDRVSGFVLPKLNVEEKVSLVTVEWRGFCYHIEWQYLDRTELIDKILSVLRVQSKFSRFCARQWKDYFMGLSQSDLNYLQNLVIQTENPLEQFESAFSILVRDEKYFYKLCTYSYQREALFRLYMKRLPSKTPQAFSHLVLPTNIIYNAREFPIFQFDAQPHQPLTRKEAAECLVDFIEGALKALDELHKIGLAHRDVRLPNFCFSNEYEVMLIDFDRSTGVENESSDSNANFFMRLPGKTRNSKGLDLKQLGLMIHTILSKPDFDEHLLKIPITSSDPFVNELITDGTLNEFTFGDWKRSQSDIVSKTTCKDVIMNRNPSP